MKKVTQADIAKAVGVSPATIALVVGNSNSPLRHRLNPATVLRIQQKAREMGYSPHRGAQLMRMGRSNLIVLLNFGGYSELAAKRVYHIGRLVHEIGYDFQVIDSYWWGGDPEYLVEQVAGLRPEGLVVVGSVQNDFGASHVEKLIKHGIPLVSIGLYLAGVPRVRYDAKSPFRTLTNWYLDHGRNRIVLVLNQTEKNTLQVSERLAGFQEAILERTGNPPVVLEGLSYQNMAVGKGIEAAVLMVRSKKVHFDPFRPGMEAMQALAHWPVLPNAILGINDDFAIGAATVCARRNIAIPEDIMISGFDDLVFGTQGPVSLTSVEQPIESMCETAINMLQERIGKEPSLELEMNDKVLPCEIIWRDSTAASRDLPVGK